MTTSAIRLVESDSRHVDLIRDYVGQPMTAAEICQIAAKATLELMLAIREDDTDAMIAAERRLVAVGALAQANANRLERRTA